MPLRIVLTFAALVVACAGIVLLAWTSGMELYIFLPPRRLYDAVPRPPTPPGVMLIAMGLLAVVTAFSRHYGLVLCSLFTALLLLGSPIGYFAFSWTPSLAQHLLCAAMGATIFYGWKHQEYLDY